MATNQKPMTEDEWVALALAGAPEDVGDRLAEIVGGYLRLHSAPKGKIPASRTRALRAGRCAA